jgi:LacI family transcriptional regulator
MAEAALELLIADLRRRRSGAPHKIAERVLSHALIVRESSGPPPDGKKSKARKSRKSG